MTLLLLYQSSQSGQNVAVSSVAASGSVASFVSSTTLGVIGVSGSSVANLITTTSDAPGLISGVDASGFSTFGSTISDAASMLVGISGAGVASFGHVQIDGQPTITGQTTIGSAQSLSNNTRSDGISSITGIIASGATTAALLMPSGQSTGIIATTAVAPLTSQLNAVLIGSSAGGDVGLPTESGSSSYQASVQGIMASGQASSSSTTSDALINLVGIVAVGQITAPTSRFDASTPIIGASGDASTGNVTIVQSETSILSGVIASASAGSANDETDCSLLGSLASTITAAFDLLQTSSMTSAQGSAFSGAITTSQQQSSVSAIQSLGTIGLLASNQMAFLTGTNATGASSGSLSIIIPGGIRTFNLPYGAVGSASLGIVTIKITKTHVYHKAGRGAMNTTNISRKRQQHQQHRTHAEEMRLLLQKMQQQAEALKTELAATKTKKTIVVEPETIVVEPTAPSPDQHQPVITQQSKTTESNIVSMAKQIQLWKDIAQQEDTWLLGEESESDEVLLGIL